MVHKLYLVNQISEFVEILYIKFFWQSFRKIVLSFKIMIWVGWLVVFGLTALWDNISGYIGPSAKEREKQEKG